MKELIYVSGTPAREHFAFADLPILASTHFCIEILLRGSVLDVRSVVEVLACDPCAVLRIFAQIAQEQPDLSASLLRLDECIIVLGISGLKRALTQAPSSWQQQAILNSFAEHGMAIGTYCRTTASLSGLCEETAFFVGLLHEVGHLPTVSQGRVATEAEAAHVAVKLAESAGLPLALQRALRSLHETSATDLWSLLVQAAHRADVTTGKSCRDTTCITN